MVERLLTRLDRRFGRYAFGNITYALVVLQALGFAIVLVRPELAEKLVLNRAALLDGEWWRLVTLLVYPASTSPWWVIFSLYWLFTMGRALEEEWGSFRYEIFWALGVVATIGSVVAGGSTATVVPLIMSLFLAFATLWPNYQLRVFFVLPVPVKWLALLDACGIAANIGLADGLDKLVPIAAVANYLLFFGPTLFEKVLRFVKEGARGGARARFRHDVKSGHAEARRQRACAMCGKAEPDVEIRICDCAKCGGVDRALCLEHAKSH